VVLDDGTPVTADLVEGIFAEESLVIETEIRAFLAGRQQEQIDREIELYRQATEEARNLFTETDFRPFLSTRSELAG